MGRIKKLIVLLCSTTALSLTAAAAVGSVNAEISDIVINEICAKNTVYAASDGKYYDWIELYNPSDSNFDLSGYGLSDNKSKPYKFIFPDETVIAGGERLMIFCDSALSSLEGQLSAAFGLSTDGETIILTDKNGGLVDTVTFGAIESNVSYGRSPDGSDNLTYMKMTPDAPNITDNKPAFSKTSGFYSNPFDLSISTSEKSAIYYTLDGSNPSESSIRYTAPISINDISSTANTISARTDISPTTSMSSVTAPKNPVDKAVVIKAVAVDENGNYSDVVTETYFVGYQNKASYYENMKILSIVTDKDNLYDNENGIYVLGKVYEDWKNSSEYSSSTAEWMIPANYTQKGSEWEREATLQIFENGSLSLAQDIGIRIHGGATRSMTQKSFNIYARSEYGLSKLNFDLFSGSLHNKYNGEIIDEFDTFMIRNGGNDSQYTRFRDKLNQSLVSDRNFLTQEMQPCIVFINGEYWGQYEITEKLSNDYIKFHYDISKKNVCIIKNEELDTGEEVTFTEYNQLRKWINATDFSSNDNYNELCSKVDMQGFMDYISAEIYFNNWDWGSNNVATWKSTKTDPSNPYADGKWRFIMFDTEYSVNLYGQTGASANTFSQIMNSKSFISDLLNGAMKNDTFKKQFCLTFMDMSNYNFDSAKISELISELSSAYHDTTIDTFNRFWPDWPGGHWAESNLSKEISSVRTFYNNRFASITNHVKSSFALSGNLAKVTIQNDDSQGSITVNTITPQMKNGSWSGSYYTDYPITLTAEPKSGYQFAYWETSTGEQIKSVSAEITFNSNITISAIYKDSQNIMGDVNLDGVVNNDDALLLQNYLLNVAALTEEQAINADLCNDNAIDVFDLTLLKKMLTDDQ